MSRDNAFALFVKNKFYAQRVKNTLLSQKSALILAINSENFPFSSISHHVSTIILFCLLFGLLILFEIGNKTDFQNFCINNPFHAKCESNCLKDHENNFEFHHPSSGPGYFLMKARTGQTLINCHHRFPENTLYYWFVEKYNPMNENEIIWMMHENNFIDSKIQDDPYNLDPKTYINSR